MCRMLAFAGHFRIEDLLCRFQRLSISGKSLDDKGHRDGWGIGYYTDTGCTLFKKAECAATSKKYVEIVEIAKRENPHVFLAHVRKASPQTPVTDREAHPFQRDNYLFCHNGSISAPDGKPFTELDSVLFFDRVMETSLKEAATYFRAFQYTSLTCLLTDGHTIWAYRDFEEKEREKEEYYTLYYLKTKEFVLFCSEPIIEGEWILMKNRELITCSPDLSLVTEFIQS